MMGGHGGYSFGERNACGEQPLEFCDVMEFTVADTCFRRQKNKLVYHTISYLWVMSSMGQ